MTRRAPRRPHRSSKTAQAPGPRPLAPLVRPQRANHFPLVERLLGRPDDLISLVAFAREEDGVALTREIQRLADRSPAVDDAVMRFPGHARFDIVENALWVFGPGIVGGRDGDIGETSRDLTHRRAFAPIPIPAGAEHEDQDRKSTRLNSSHLG